MAAEDVFVGRGTAGGGHSMFEKYSSASQVSHAMSLSEVDEGELGHSGTVIENALPSRIKMERWSELRMVMVDIIFLFRVMWLLM